EFPATEFIFVEFPATLVTLADIPATVVTFADIPATVVILPCSTVVGLIATQAPLSLTNICADTEFQYKAPLINALPSLSTVGAEDLEPKYLSSKSS
ncbi:MAG: hypothetical protein RIT11_1179, partial [Pseudomonadota bacterium]